MDSDVCWILADVAIFWVEKLLRASDEEPSPFLKLIKLYVNGAEPIIAVEVIGTLSVALALVVVMYCERNEELARLLSGVDVGVN
jgi:hypothetical protein